ncbi:universal stress protein [Salix suchowensis]|nr:universal stress protein [Salix suchowensis]
MADDMGAAKERRILVVVDESEESMNALSWCLKNVLVSTSSSIDTLILLYVKPPRVVYSALDGTADCVIEKAKRMCREQFQDVETMIDHGDPRDFICQIVEKLHVDMLVMGSHGYGVIKRAFLGSVSNHCAQNVKCPVLIVKRPKSAFGSK